MSQTPVPLYPSNDISFLVALYDIPGTTGVRSVLTSGTVTAFLATSNLPTATAADPTLTTTATYIAARGKWLVGFLGSALTPTLLNSLFAAVTPYCILTVNSTDIRVYVEMVYTASRPATVG